MQQHARSPLLPVLALVALLLPLVALGSWPLLDPDESRTAEVGREILERGDWVVPHINGVPRLDKPILTYAAVAGSLDLLGSHPFAVRLPAYLALAATAAMAGFAFRRELGRDAAALACLMIASAPLVGIAIRSGTIDSILTFWTTLAIVSFWRGMNSGRSLPWSLLAWCAVALGVLTKGPVAILIPLSAALPAAARLRKLSAVFSIAGITAATLIVYPWVGAVQARHPEFLRYVLHTETIERTTSDLQRTGPLWLPLVALLIGAAPWSIGLIAALSQRRRSWSRLSAQDLLLTGWILIPMIVFTLSQSRRPQYVLPLIPAVAIALSRLWVAPSPPGREAAAGTAMIAALLLAIALPVAVAETDLPTSLLALAALGGSAAWGITTILLWKRSSPRHLALAAFALAFFFPAFVPLIRVQAEEQSGRATAVEFRRLGLDSEELIGLHTYSPSLAFVLGTDYRVVTHHGRELGGNYIASRYAELIDQPLSPLRSRGWFEERANNCSEPMILLVRTDDRSTLRDLEDRRAMLVARTDRFSLWRPCGPEQR